MVSNIEYIGLNNNSVNINSETRNSSNLNDKSIEPSIICFGKNLAITKPQLITIILLCLFFFLDSSFNSLYVPFFPGVATEKGLSQTQIGIIFGVYPFVILILSPIFGKYIDVIGVRFLFLTGVFIASTSQLTFGFLDRWPDGNSFFIASIANQMVSALGTSMGLSYAIVGYYTPNRISTFVALLETFAGLGYMIGPVLGGFLFQIGGFQLPFFFVGGTSFLVFIVSLLKFPKPNPLIADPNRKTTLPILPLLKILRFDLTLMILFVAALSMAFIDPAIELHLKSFNLTSSELGLIFFIPSFIYVITTPLIGNMCDKFPKCPPLFMIICTATMAIAFSLIGPIPFFKLPLNLYLFNGAYFLYGLSFGGLYIPVYPQLSTVAGQAGYPVNDLRTQGIISGVFCSVWSLGCMLGPILGGYIVEVIGFDYASFIMVIIYLFTGFFYTFCYAFSENNLIYSILLDEDKMLDD